MEQHDDVDNIIHNILDNSQTWTIQEKMPQIVKEIDNLKASLKVYVCNCDFDISAILNEGTELCIESKELIEEMEACKTEIEQETMAEVLQSIENHDIIAKELELIMFSLGIIYDVIQCSKCIKNIEEAKKAANYTRVIESVYNLAQLIENPSEGFDQLEVYSNLKMTAEMVLMNSSIDLCNRWDKMISYSCTARYQSHQSMVIIKIKLDNSMVCVDTLNALDISKILPEKISAFATFLKEEVFLPILRNDGVVYEESQDYTTITFDCTKQLNKPHYADCIANMKMLFRFLNKRLNVEFANGKTIMKMFGKLICYEFCEMLINECFIHTVPNNTVGLNCYGHIINDIEDFQQFLVMMKVFPDECISLLSYMDNINVLFANRSSQYFLENARSIMLKDLSLTISIGVEKIPEETSKPDVESADSATVEALDIFEKTIPKSLFYFPLCLISKSAQELLDLVNMIMEQAVQCSDVVCKKLYYTVRLIFELYDAVVPYHHENYLQTIPQYVALFHNNCMYLAHSLQTLGDRWLALLEGRRPDYAVGFLDLVQKMRELGYKHLTVHMQQQRKQILDNIRSSDLNCIVVKDVLGDNAEAAVRQCLRQLQLLKNVWIGVFPANVFTKLIATLANMFVDELIHRVCTVEDISMEMATQLTDMYTIVVQKLPQLFQNPTDVEMYVKSWTKLQELIFVLGGSLKDIENHWKDGTGPLAVHFQVDELRSLIKALFQNTQLRANLLSKIK